MKFFAAVLVVLLFVAAGPLSAEVFRWSWEKEEKVEDRTSDVGGRVPGETKVIAEEEVTEQERRTAEKGLDAGAYGELVEENLELRSMIDEKSREKESVHKENERLSRETKDLEGKITELVSVVQDLRKEGASAPGSPDRIAELESSLATAKREKARLGEELQRLQQEQNTIPDSSVAGPPPLPGSDLFRRIEKENALLKEKLARIDAVRRKAEKDREKMAKREDLHKSEVEREIKKRKALGKELAEVRLVEKEHRKAVKKVLKQIPTMEKKLTDLRGRLEEKDTAFSATEKDLETMKAELQRREYRLMKAEKMTILMEKAREEVTQVSDKEKRDMHYNMAAVFAARGRSKDAEREYLRALRIDPADADVHYNLGILYDDELNGKHKAVMHYRRYLKLRPHANDVDKVKLWLIAAETELRR